MATLPLLFANYILPDISTRYCRSRREFYEYSAHR